MSWLGDRGCPYLVLKRQAGVEESPDSTEQGGC